MHKDTDIVEIYYHIDNFFKDFEKFKMEMVFVALKRREIENLP